MGLGLLTISSTGFAATTTGKDNKTVATEEVLEDFSFIEISQELFLEEIFLEDGRPEKIMFFDDANELVYETENTEKHEFQVQVLLRRSDLVLEFDGVKYYRVND